MLPVKKGNRSMEILITSTSTNALIFGKVLAGAAASILQVGVMLGVSIMAYQYNADIWNHTLDFLFNIPVNVLLSFALFGTLGYLFYTFIYGAMGSMVFKSRRSIFRSFSDYNYICYLHFL